MKTRTAACVLALAAACGGDPVGGGNPPGGNPPGNNEGAATVGPNGGTVALMRFGLTGDTRPGNCGDTANYPSAVIQAIVGQLDAQGLDFVLDLGDHMYVCNDDLNVATTQMGLYTGATAAFHGTWFMTMGNHECGRTPCLAGSSSANYVAFMNALAPVAALPYYSFDVQTSLGLARFVVVADNAWSADQQTWLEATLADADAKARYTIVARHHPTGDTSVTTNPTSEGIILAHKLSLFLTGHSHEYRHSTRNGGRTLVLGTGGAPLAASNSGFHGQAIVEQQATGELKITVSDTSGVARDTFTVQ